LDTPQTLISDDPDENFGRVYRIRLLSATLHKSISLDYTVRYKAYIMMSAWSSLSTSQTSLLLENANIQSETACSVNFVRCSLVTWSIFVHRFLFSSPMA
jgi:hypothetical protein